MLDISLTGYQGLAVGFRAEVHVDLAAPYSVRLLLKQINEPLYSERVKPGELLATLRNTQSAAATLLVGPGLHSFTNKRVLGEERE
jgi:hypothetical protein